jgi:hypothetical protein
MPHNPSQLTFGMEMIFQQKVKIDWQLLKEQCHQAIANNAKENKTRIQHDSIKLATLSSLWRNHMSVPRRPNSLLLPKVPTKS